MTLKENVLGYECKHVVFSKNKISKTHDTHFVKLIEHHKDGTTKIIKTLFNDFKRDVYITKEGKRNHKQKKTYEEIANLDKYSVNEARLPIVVSRILKEYHQYNFTESPYVYGASTNAATIIKHNFIKKYPNLKSPNTVAALDIETNVDPNSVKELEPDEIIVISLSFKDKIFCGINTKWLKTDPKRLNEQLNKYLSKYVEERNIKVEWVFSDNAGLLCKRCIERAHEWSPDFISVWNINFDLPNIIKALEKAGYDIEDTFNDSIVPKEYRRFDYKPGEDVKFTVSGKRTSLNEEQKFPYVECLAGFIFIDSMCAYKNIRLAKQAAPSYALDAILTEELNLTKLKFEEANHLSGLDWHIFLQRGYKEEYVIYNLFDNISLELLDEKTTDLSFQLPGMVESSQYNIASSRPKIICDDFYHYAMERGYVMGTFNRVMISDIDKSIFDLKGWIVNLRADLIVDNALNQIQDGNGIFTNIRVFNYDLDVKGSYPHGQLTLNIGRETTKCELISLDGVDLNTLKMNCLDILGGPTNAVTACTELLGLPKLLDWKKIYKELN